jgi:hypothetical protein
MTCGQVNVADTARSVSENRAHAVHTAWIVSGAGGTFGSQDGRLKMGYSLPKKKVSCNS